MSEIDIDKIWEKFLLLERLDDASSNVQWAAESWRWHAWNDACWVPADDRSSPFRDGRAALSNGLAEATAPAHGSPANGALPTGFVRLRLSPIFLSLSLFFYHFLSVPLSSFPFLKKREGTPGSKKGIGYIYCSKEKAFYWNRRLRYWSFHFHLKSTNIFSSVEVEYKTSSET